MKYTLVQEKNHHWQHKNVVKMTTFGAASGKNAIKTTISVQQLSASLKPVLQHNYEALIILATREGRLWIIHNSSWFFNTTPVAWSQAHRLVTKHILEVSLQLG